MIEKKKNKSKEEFDWEERFIEIFESINTVQEGRKIIDFSEGSNLQGLYRLLTFVEHKLSQERKRSRGEIKEAFDEGRLDGSNPYKKDSDDTKFRLKRLYKKFNLV